MRFCYLLNFSLRFVQEEYCFKYRGYIEVGLLYSPTDSTKGLETCLSPRNPDLLFMLQGCDGVAIGCYSVKTGCLRNDVDPCLMWPM